MKKNKVTFSNINNIYIYLKYDVLGLWWTEEDNFNAIISLHNDINRLKLIHPKIEISDAKKLLFQTKFIYDPQNFL